MNIETLYFKRIKRSLKNKGTTRFRWMGECNYCGKVGEKYSTNNPRKMCLNCAKSQVNRWRSLPKNKKKLRKADKNRRSKNNQSVFFRIKESIRVRAYDQARKNGKKLNHKITTLENIIGCELEFFRKYIESRFDESMNWLNYSVYWNIDHIMPVSHFDLSDSKEFKRCNHWTNLQPMEVFENRSKSNKLIFPI